MTLGDTKYVDLTLNRALDLLRADGADPSAFDVLQGLSRRIATVAPEQDRFKLWCDRADALYYAEEFTNGGADLWPHDPNAHIPGRAHVSVNSPAAYVDIPAALQAVEPEENMLATDTTKEARQAAAHEERLYYAWKRDQDFGLFWHKACVVKGLYGRTAAKVVWDADAKKPTVELVEQPRNLYLGWQSSSYEKLDWAAYVQRVDPNVIADQFGVDVVERKLDDGSVIPWLQTYPVDTQPARSWLYFGNAQIELWDYWYRRYNGKRLETWNVVVAGNLVVRPPTRYRVYDGTLPFLPVFNTFVPGTPTGRPELYDMEHLIREKYERITAGSQMIASGVAGDYWQLVGPDAPTRVSSAIKPKRNEVVAPGPGNRIESITPFIAQFQLEQYLGRLDREMAVVSGLNDLLLGLAPAQVLSSSKAINALIANYESRLSMRRGLLYAWRRSLWDRAVHMWASKDARVRAILDSGGGTLEVIDPSLSPKDELETASRAANLMNAKLWSQRRGMNAVGVDDPETEQELIREERTDATMFPQDVEVMAQLLAALQNLGLQPNTETQQQGSTMLTRGQSDLRTALGAATPDNTTSTQGPGEVGMTPPEALVPGGSAAGPQNAPFAQAQGGGAAPQPPVMQTMVSGGKASSRILTQTQLGRR